MDFLLGTDFYKGSEVHITGKKKKNPTGSPHNCVTPDDGVSHNLQPFGNSSCCLASLWPVFSFQKKKRVLQPPINGHSVGFASLTMF